MKRYTVGQMRARLAEALDTAEGGEAVIVERRGVRFDLRVASPSPRRARPARSLITREDPAVEAGEWSWAPDANGLRFEGRERKR
jgi:hypothetical protein